jgi:hypothetical protein
MISEFYEIWKKLNSLGIVLESKSKLFVSCPKSSKITLFVIARIGNKGIESVETISNSENYKKFQETNSISFFSSNLKVVDGKIKFKSNQVKGLESFKNRVGKFSNDVRELEIFCDRFSSSVASLEDQLNEKIVILNDDRINRWVIKPENKVGVIFDNYEPELTVYSEKIQNWINFALLNESNDSEKEDTSKKDAYGNTIHGEPKLWPSNVILPGIGKTILRENNKEIPCNTRYGLTGQYSYPCSDTTIQRVKDSSEWITDKCRKGKTWQTFPRKDKERALLISYFDGKSSLDEQIETSSVFFKDEENIEIKNESSFEEECKKILEFIPEKIENEIYNRIVVIGKEGKQRRRVITNQYTSGKTYKRAINEWFAGCLNSENKERIVPRIFEITETLSRCFRRDGSKVSRYSAVSVENILDVFLKQDKKASLIMIKDIVHSQIESVKLCTYNKLTQKHINNILCFLSLGLYHIGFKKEEYTHTFPYVLGRYLKLLNMLHEKYNEIIMNKIPKNKSTLIGYDFFDRTILAPLDSFTRLAARSGIYYSWAKAYSGKDEGLIKWIIYQIGSLFSRNDIRKCERFSHAEKAIFILGYLSDNKEDIKGISKNDSYGFAVGRYFHFIDKLHELYCDEVRKSRPGVYVCDKFFNSIMSGTGNIDCILNRLGNRATPYMEWSKRYEGNNSNLAKWSFGKINFYKKIIDENSSGFEKSDFIMGFYCF